MNLKLNEEALFRNDFGELDYQFIKDCKKYRLRKTVRKTLIAIGLIAVLSVAIANTTSNVDDNPTIPKGLTKRVGSMKHVKQTIK